jgi:hypothetical protein
MGSGAKQSNVRAHVLTPKHLLAIEALTGGGTVKEAADAAGVDRRTISRWAREPEFAKHLRDEVEALRCLLQARLLAAAESAIEGLEKAAANGNARACSTLLRYVYRTDAEDWDEVFQKNMLRRAAVDGSIHLTEDGKALLGLD